VDNIRSVITAASGSPEGMEEHPKKCTAPVPDATFQSAEEYVRDLGAAMEQLPDVQKLFNGMTSKDEECLKKQFDAYTACIQDAECHGVNPSKCDSLKPPGDWAPPQ
jgi:hypothetical protein